jgi:hypothetical protein
VTRRKLSSRAPPNPAPVGSRLRDVDQTRGRAGTVEHGAVAFDHHDLGDALGRDEPRVELPVGDGVDGDAVQIEWRVARRQAAHEDARDAATAGTQVDPGQVPKASSLTAPDPFFIGGGLPGARYFTALT